MSDKEFRQIVLADMIEHGELLIKRLIELESLSRHAMVCDGDPVEAGRYADEAYATFMEIPLKLMPTIVMGLADRFNREHEAYTATLDQVQDALGHLRLFEQMRQRGQSGLAEINLELAVRFLESAIEDSPYERNEEES